MPTKELSPQYNPQEVEDAIYRIWEKSGFFNPDQLPTKRGAKRRKGYSIVVPPPNVTGSLHMGHALNATIQDILIRKKRMEGYDTLWLPGTDHAGIATQNVIEKQLKKEGISRQELGREKFLERVEQWKEKYGHIILDQFKKLGCSMDWSRIRFTLDPEYQTAVKAAFLHYYKKGWLYRGERAINWCIRCGTNLSDLEITYQQEAATLYYLQYGPLVVATTRPETTLGDTAIAVNPKDERYQKYIGKNLEIETALGSVKMKVIEDAQIDPEFGTGAMKVTPAHDLHDFELSQKYHLEKKQVIGPDGRMTKLAEKYAGLKIAEARTRIAEDLAQKNLLVKTEPYLHNTARCYRCNTVLEPILSTQWFVKMQALAQHAIRAVTSGKVAFHPKRWEKVYLERLRNERDWTISRQIWWGHKIPMGYCVACGEVRPDPKIKANWFFVRHGETNWNIERREQGQSAATSLNETGKTQMKTAAQQLAEHRIDLIISSDAKRAKESAEIISRELGGVEIVYDSVFRERNYGELEGLTKEEMRARGFDTTANELEKYDFIYTAPGGESIADVEKRVLKGLAAHKDRHQHQNIVIVSHGGTLATLFRALKNIKLEELSDIKIHNASIMHFSVSDACAKCGGDFIEQDQNVLDTWFSSALWPFATLGWPNQVNELKRFYPTQVLSTARDIINLWVARMVFSGMEFTDREPFRDVLIHATILTKDGKRMSKSLGTGIDPMDLISRFGADATRFGLIWQTMGAQDIHWSEDAVAAGKKFANKIWNASRFVFTNLSKKDYHIIKAPRGKTAKDKIILSKLKKTKEEVERKMERYEFGQALHVLYDFFWHTFCDLYIEAAKEQLQNRELKESTEEVLFFTFSRSLKLLHPFMPFLTEEIWSFLPLKDRGLLIVASWPQ